MIDRTLISSGFPLFGGGAIGFAVCYALKIMKLVIIGLGLLVLLIGYLNINGGSRFQVVCRKHM
jgi:uncharacterized membrane protein (Fun14 family)